MITELSNFAARLRETISGVSREGREAGEVKNFPSYHSRSSREISEREFSKLALELFALQFKCNSAYRNICVARNLTPEIVEHWTRIPAVPAAAFKELELTCLGPDERTAVFHSSGTTEQKPSRHFHNAESLAVYEVSLWLWFEQNFFVNSKFKIQNSKLVVLTPPPEQAPHSSLVHMFETVRKCSVGCSSRRSLQRSPGPQPTGALGTAHATTSAFVGKLMADGAWTLDFEAVLAALNSSLVTRSPRRSLRRSPGHSSLVLGTAFSFVHLLDFLGEQDLSFRLSSGSRAMETGGYKNRSRTMPKDELHTLITERLGIPPENIVSEYGMSELSSQAYDGVAGDGWRVTGKDSAPRHSSLDTRYFLFPPWARVQIVSPETGRGVADGETGLIRVFDLANVFSVMAIQTGDLGIRRGDGFELLGRAQFAEPRGCSLMSIESK